MVGEIREEIKKHFFSKLLEDVLGYWRIYDYLKLRSKLQTRGAIEIKTENEFWSSILGQRYVGKRVRHLPHLRNGQVIKPKDVFLCEWAPKLPGQIWTTQGSKDLIDGYGRIDGYFRFKDELYSVLDPYGKEKVVSAGFGSLRLNPRTNREDYCMYMSLVTADNWHCDRGIPLVVSKSVYNEFYKYARSGAPWVESMEGILHLEEDLPFTRMIPRAIGAALPQEIEATLQFKPFLPKCFIYVSSPLSLKLRFNDSHPDCVAWTMFETRMHQHPLSYTYTTFDPSSGESTEKAVDFINWYVGRYGGSGSRIITDFDGKQPRLSAAVNLASDPMRSSRGKEEFKVVMNRVNRWIMRSL